MTERHALKRLSWNDRFPSPLIAWMTDFLTLGRYDIDWVAPPPWTFDLVNVYIDLCLTIGIRAFISVCGDAMQCD